MSNPGYIIGPDGIPIPAGGWSVYNSYVTDPQYQTYLLISWTCGIAAFFLLTLPSIVSWIRERRFEEGGWSIGMKHKQEDGYIPILESSYAFEADEAAADESFPPSYSARAPRAPSSPSPLYRRCIRLTKPMTSFLLRTSTLKIRNTTFTFPVGPILICLLIPAILLLTLLPMSQLSQNTNRAGFLALGLLPFIFLLASKTSPISLLTGRSWVAVNFLHRWVSRGAVVLVMIHGFGWMGIFASAGQLGERLRDGQKEQRGVLAIAFFLLITATSILPIRKLSYPVFFSFHMLGIVGILVAVARHTIFSTNWIWASAAIYAFDLAGRAVRARWSWCRLVLADGQDGGDRGAVKVFVEGAEGGWRAGQFVQFYAFFTPPSLDSSKSLFSRTIHSLFSSFRPFESHPFSISNAPHTISVQDRTSSSSKAKGIELLIRGKGKGSWTGDLCRFVHEQSSLESSSSPTSSPGQTSVYVPCLIIGPYGGLGYSSTCSKETALMVAGGSGISFIMGCLDEVVGRVVRGMRGARTNRVELVWCVSKAEHVEWYAQNLDNLTRIAEQSGRISINVRIFVTDRSYSSETSSISSSSSAGSQSRLTRLNQNPNISIVALRNSHPSVDLLLSQTVEEAINPCGPVCGRECQCDHSSVGEKTQPAVAVASGAALEKKSHGTDDEIEVLPSCCASKEAAGEAPGVSFSCGASNQPLDEKEVHPVEVKAKGGCCGSCGLVRDQSVQLLPEKRTGGLDVVVCGPTSLIADMKNAVASLPLDKVLKIGGVDFHEESYSL